MQEAGTRSYLPSRRFVVILCSIIGFLILAFAAFAAVRYIQLRSRANSLGISAENPTGTASEPAGGRISFFDLFSFAAPSQTIDSDTIARQNKYKNVSPYYITQNKPAPVITSISKTTFGNGDTITIHGENFTFSNTIFLSIDLKNKFANIPSFDGKTLVFTANLTLSDQLNKDFANLTTTQRAFVVNKIETVKAKETGESGMWHIPATIQVQNENGDSAPMNVFVDILQNVR